MLPPRRAIWLVALGVCATAGAATPPDAVGQARAAMASASFEKALAISDKGLRSTKEATQRGQLELVRAECFHALRKTAQMKDALEKALRDDPLAALDESSVNPELVAELANLRKTLSGKLVISGSFVSADAPLVMMDDVKLGLAPVTMRADVGRHHVKIQWPAGDTQEQDVVVRAAAETAVVLSRAATSGLAVPEPTPSPSPAPVADTSPPPTPAPAPAGPAPAATVSSRPSRSSGALWPFISLAAGAAAVIAGVVCLGVAGSEYSALTGGGGVSTLMLDRDEATRYAARGQTTQIAGIVLTVVGVLAAGAGGLGLMFDSGSPHFSLAAGPQGASFALSGAWP